MAVVVINQTNVSTSKLKKIIRFVKPKNTVLPKITIRRVVSFCFYGSFYYSKRSRSILASVGRYDKFPTWVIRNKESQREGYISGFWLHSQEEALIYLLAHELRHAYQDQNPQAQRIGKKFKWQKFSETDCDTYALQKLEGWRKMKQKCNVV
jgi:hypothetical protein